MHCLRGGISPIDPGFIRLVLWYRVLEFLDVVAIHGFPLDWNHWHISEWPDNIRYIEDIAGRPVWVSEVGVSSFGVEEIQELSLQRTAELLHGRAKRIHRYCLYDLPDDWEATTRHKEAEGAAYHRHFPMGPQPGICQ